MSTLHRDLGYIACLLAVLLLTACVGGDGGGGSDPAAPTPVATTYTVGGNVSGLSGGGLVLYNNGGGPLAISGNGVFTFATAFANAAGYNVTVATLPSNPEQTCTVSNGVGTVNGNVTNVAVTCNDWGWAVLIETNAGYAGGPQVAIDPAGNAIAVWTDADSMLPFRSNIWANRYTAGSGWGAAVLIETDDTNDALNPRIAIDPNGNAIAVWTQSNGLISFVWANRYTAGSGWGTPVSIGANVLGAVASPRIAVDAGGNAIAVWTTVYVFARVWANRYTAGVGWGTAAVINSMITSFADNLQVAFDGSGNATAVWAQKDDGTARIGIWANRYTAGVGWGTATLIQTDNASDAFFPQIAVDRNGNAIAVWEQDAGTLGHKIWANRYTAGVGWGSAALIDASGGGSANSLSIAFDPNGNAIAVWSEQGGSRRHIWANRYTAGGGWGTAAVIETTEGSGYLPWDASAPHIAFDPNGNALAVWYQYDGSAYSIWASRYTAVGGWGAPSRIETNNVQNAQFPQIAIDANGNAIAVWQQSDGTRQNIWANRFQ